jgi:hypothetical protein
MIAAEPKTRAERGPEEAAPKRRTSRAARNGAAVLTAAFGLALAQPAAAQSEPTLDRAA